MYIFTWALLTVIVSSLARNTRSALIFLLISWCLVNLLLPKFAIEEAANRYPIESAQVFQSKLESEVYTPERQQAILKFKQQTLAQYGVDNVADLPFAWSGAQLQFAENYSDQVFDRLYGQRRTQLEAQSLHYQSAALFSPFIALQSLSMAAAATDLTHHQLFDDAGEAHRRLMQKVLNNDLRDNSHHSEQSYQADHKVWQKIPDFHYQCPPIIELFSRYAWATLGSILWMLTLLGVAYLAILHLEKEGQR